MNEPIWLTQARGYSITWRRLKQQSPRAALAFFAHLKLASQTWQQSNCRRAVRQAIGMIRVQEAM